MGIRTIPLSRLDADLRGALNECADSGQAIVVELLDQRLVAIQALEPSGDDPLIDDLIRTNAAFRARVQRSRESPRKPFAMPQRARE